MTEPIYPDGRRSDIQRRALLPTPTISPWGNVPMDDLVEIQEALALIPWRRAHRGRSLRLIDEISSELHRREAT